MSDFPCKNPNCSSYGRPHPNCRCGPGGNYAEGGAVNKEFYCSSDNKHSAGCKYFAEGGMTIHNPSLMDDPHAVLGHAAVHHGLHSLMKNVGKASLAKSDKNDRLLEDMKSQKEWQQNPADTALPRTVGTRLSEHLMNQEHEKAAEHMQGHLVVGNIAIKKLTPILHRLSGPLLEQSGNPEALRSSVDYLHSAIKGHDALNNHLSQAFDTKSMDVKHDEKRVEGLKKHLDEIDADPSKALDIGSLLGHYLPTHAAANGALTAAAVDYFKQLKPMKTQMAPLDAITPLDKMAEAKYNRQLGIAENPMLVLKHAKDGTLQSQDLTTIKTLYPGLAKSIADKMTEALIDSKTKGTSLNYKQKQGLSQLMGQPLDSTMTSTSAQAIIQANSPKHAPPTPGKGGNQKATKTAVETSEKVNKLYQTTLQARQINKKD